MQSQRDAERLSGVEDIRPFREVYAVWKDAETQPGEIGIEALDATLAVMTANDPSQLRESLNQEVEKCYEALLPALEYIGEEELAGLLKEAYQAYDLELPMLYAFHALHPDNENSGIAALALYALGVFGLDQVFKRKESSLCTEDHRKETRETALCTVISCLAFAGAGLLAYQAVACAPSVAEQLRISTVERAVCAGISMGVDTILLAALLHSLLVLRMYPNDGDNPSRELLRLRKELRAPYRL